ncbi:MAG: putative lipid II flippase FtsW [gamma proteobacterium symbiont of Bathyaustriella thionipta]|nr:putative lipid II flippase FtsW [gamma proteobacterium symbiont of Bathyaustriella thionipta]MCU7949314.1 putative lipid II flippase FtsW [gamma proteobacterium symbiont of Bathyaustriella thionipta]MCU7953382.1 putative lipid II flippase FtsW [gamma proteobacterium symbiont of Bathyaustriella thionipta]MCU7955901.1 putative lipid II flippase FtsW [gamma proteobacterium symbiont of Bathyaustriella thionipta]MCU7967319.1 putative lipid II flippase FtsW [gamma proteobacterium symbiont of Bathy
MSVEINIDSLKPKFGHKDKSNDTSLTELFENSARKRGKKHHSQSKVKKVKPVNKVNNQSNEKLTKRTTKKKRNSAQKSVKAIEAEKQKWLFDPWLIVITISIITLGITMVGSASISIAERNNGEPFYYLYRQLIATGLGVFLGTLVLLTPVKIWQKTGPVLLFIGIFLLIAVLLPGVGREINGSSRWIPMGVFNLQVSELIKLAMVIYLAGYLVRHNENVRKTIKGFFMPMVVLATVAVLLLMEPDLGATVVISATALGMLFLGGVRLWQFMVLILIMAVSVYYLIILEPYRLERLQSFMNPWADPFDTGFQLTQSLIAFGRGELTGVGLGNSIQKLFYLPEGHTDFLFAVLAEELGAVGAITVISLFAALVSRIFLLAKKADQVKQTFSAYMMFGLAIWIGLQAFVNIAVNMGALPTKGLTLPLMSYGGSSMMIMCVVIALVLRAEHETRFKYPLGSGFWSALSDKKHTARKSF